MTVALTTPGCPFSSFSILAEQFAQVIPVMTNVSILVSAVAIKSPLLYNPIH
ncbi:hypothetical protein CU019_1707 [Enterococcus faecium]|nr:hypothetical protein [Enterococcus faecium]MBK4820333.1 hypothetical protein [Enterococcus faecium]